MDLRGFDFNKKFSVGGWCCGWVHNDFSVLRLSKLVLGLKSCPMVLRKYECCLKINGCFMDVSRVFQGRLEGVSSSQGVSKVFEIVIPMVSKGCFKEFYFCSRCL